LEREGLVIDDAWGSPDLAIAHRLSANGFHIFRDSIPSRRWFEALYVAFDEVLTAILNSEALESEWHRCVSEWQDEADTESYYCNVPADFRDRSGRADKRDKSYLQFTLDFAMSDAFANSQLSERDDVRKLFGMLEQLHFLTAELFFKAIKAIDAVAPGTASKMVERTRLAPIVIKLLKYNRNESRFATDPHFDKSALSLVLHSDDPQPTLKIASSRHTRPRYSEFFVPMKYPADALSKNSALLINGICLNAIGLEAFPPTPHSVPPVTDRPHRFSVVAFYLVPHLDTSKLCTVAPFMNDTAGIT